MAYRKRVGRRQSRKVFRRTAGTNRRNVNTRPVLRGGIRL